MISCLHSCDFTSKFLLNSQIICSPLYNKFRNCSSSSKKVVQFRANASSVDALPSNDDSNSKKKNPIKSVLDLPSTIWNRAFSPMSNRGLARRSVWEGGVGLFMLSGATLLALTIIWLRGFHFRSQFKKYQMVIEFAQVCGICVGTPVRIRGVTVGNVVRIDSSMKSVDAVVEVDDDKIVIPRNSLIEVNQSGLLMETLIDITPRDPVPRPSSSPLEPDCVKEGLIVCDREKMRGQQGVSLDALVAILTRVGQEMEEIGVQKTYRLAEEVASVIQEAQPLIVKLEALTMDLQPMLAEVRDSTLLKDVESLTKSLAEVTQDLRKLHPAILTPENTELIRRSFSSLISTLKNIESISSDVSDFTGDEIAKQNVKLLIKSLSRLL